MIIMSLQQLMSSRIPHVKRGGQRTEEFEMLVQIALPGDEPSQVRDGVAAIVRTALAEVFEVGSVEPVILMASAISTSAGLPDYGGRKIAILIIAPYKLGERRKRKLFGRVMDLSELELAIQRERIVIGIVETGSSNWSNGSGERQWLQMMSYQLP
jgi:hypothetical protein